MCPTPECLCQAVKGKRLARALRAEVPDELVRQLEGIVEQGSSDMDR